MKNHFYYISILTLSSLYTPVKPWTWLGKSETPEEVQMVDKAKLEVYKKQKNKNEAEYY